jgi:hypothetical protein
MGVASIARLQTLLERHGKLMRTYTVVSIGIALVLFGAGARPSHGARFAAPRATEDSRASQPHVDADVFVAQTATGSGNGRSCENARAVTYFNVPSNWGTGRPIAPGKVIALCGRITSTLTAQGSGTSGRPITIFFTPGARISQPACGPCLNLRNRKFITVDGGTNGIIEGTDNGTSLRLQSASTGIQASPCDNCEVKNVAIRNIYIHSGSSSEIDQTQMRAITFNGDNFRFHDNVVHDAGWAINFGRNGDSNVRVYNNDIYNVDHGVTPSFGTSGGSTGPYFIYGNHFHDFSKWDTSNNAYHHDGIHCYTVAGGAAQHITDFYIYNNRFDGNIGNNATAWIFIEGAPRHDSFDTPCADSTSNFWIFNNVLTTSPGVATNAIITLGSFGHALVANNLIDGPDAKNTRAICLAFDRTATIYNNAIGGCNQLVTGPIPQALDYNAYANCSGSFNCWWVGSTDTAEFSRHQAQGLDTHSVANLKARTGSNVLGVGKNLTSSCVGRLTPLCFDINGALRPKSMRPDVGAYQAETAAIARRSIGRARLGGSKGSIEQFYGRTRTVRSKRPFFDLLDVRGAFIASYHLHGGLLRVSYVQSRVVAISTTSRYYTTIGGLGVGAPVSRAKIGRSGWRRCGENFLRRRGGTATAVRVARGRIIAVTLSASPNTRCGK